MTGLSAGAQTVTDPEAVAIQGFGTGLLSLSPHCMWSPASSRVLCHCVSIRLRSLMNCFVGLSKIVVELELVCFSLMSAMLALTLLIARRINRLLHLIFRVDDVARMRQHSGMVVTVELGILGDPDTVALFSFQRLQRRDERSQREIIIPGASIQGPRLTLRACLSCV